PAMLLLLGTMRLMLFTNHMALRAVCDYVRKDRVLDRLVLAHAALRDLGIARPRLAVAGLNPHAGEEGAFGHEERDEIVPVFAAGGNLSARIGDTDTFLITPSGVALRDAEPDGLVTIDLAGRKLGGPERYRPSKEALMHTAVYAARPATRAVAHLHPPHAIAFGIRGEPIPLMTVTSEERLHLTPVVPPATSGSRALSDGVVTALETAPADTQVLLLARHGILAWGGSVQQACDIADLAEYTAKIAIAHAALPGRRRVLDISVPNVAGMHVYPGDPVPRVDAVRRIQAGDVCNLSLLTM